MPLNPALLNTEVRGEIGGFAATEATWAAELKANFLTELEAGVGGAAWAGGDMDNTMQILADALANSVLTHLDAMVEAMTAKHMAHIVANALVTTATTGATASACVSGGSVGTSTGTGTGTVA